MLMEGELYSWKTRYVEYTGKLLILCLSVDYYSVIYGHDEQIMYSNTLPKDVVIRLTEELYAHNRATFLFTQTRCLLVNNEKGGKDWLSIAGKYDKNVEDMAASREAVLKEIEDGLLDVIKVTVCAEPESVNGKQKDNSVFSSDACLSCISVLTISHCLACRIHDPAQNILPPTRLDTCYSLHIGTTRSAYQ